MMSLDLLAAFLQERIGFLQIADTVEAVLEKDSHEGGSGVDALHAIDAEARAQAQAFIEAI